MGFSAVEEATEDLLIQIICSKMDFLDIHLITLIHNKTGEVHLPNIEVALTNVEAGSKISSKCTLHITEDLQLLGEATTTEEAVVVHPTIFLPKTTIA